MNNPFNSFIEDNRKYIENLFSGELKTVLVVCYGCESIFITERGSNYEEFSASHCPFCKCKTKNTLDALNGNVKDKLETINNNIETAGFPPLQNPHLVDQIKRILKEPKNQKFNVIACKECHNRFILLDEDLDDVEFCPWCDATYENMVFLLNDPEANQQNQQNPNTPTRGLDKCIGALFFVKTARFEENFVLTDIDYDMNKMRFESLEDKRMALWLDNSEIYEMYEYLAVEEEGKIEEPTLEKPSTEEPPDQEA